MTTIHDAGRDLVPDPDVIRAMLDAVIPAGEPFEIRVVKLRKQTPDGLIEDPYTKAQTGFYVDTVMAASHAARYAGMHCAGVYVTLNQLPPHARSWGADRIAKGRGTTDTDILRYCYLYVDVDPLRPSDTNATASERTAARERALQLLAYLRDAGWPDPVWAGSSGSGSMMLFRIDLAPDAQPLIRRVLQGLHDLFGDDAVGIDTSVFNPARVVRLAGTVNAKAITPQPERPWTLATGKALPNPGTVTRAQLEAIAAAEPDPFRRETFTGDGYDLPAILAKAGIQHREKQTSYGVVYEIANCLTSPDHADGACFIQFHSGAVAYRCLHARCSGKGWQDVKGLLNLPERTSGPTLTAGTSYTSGNATVTEPDASGDHLEPAMLQIRRASDIEARAIEWIWKPWLPAGMVGLFAGYGGSGKSTVVLQIAAQCSIGGTLPDGQMAPLLNTLIFAAEDSPEHTIRPRLEGMEADLNRIHLVDGIRQGDGDPGWVQLRAHVALIEQAVLKHHIGLVIIDPVSSYIGDANGDKESDVRAGITPLVRMAERTGCAVLMIRHVSKAGDGTRAASRILGSTAWHDVPRVAWMLADAPDDHQPESHEDGTGDTRRVLGVVKSNLAAKPQARWCIQPADGPLRWLPDASPVTVDECFYAQSARGGKSRDAEEWLRERLAGGAQPSKTVEAAAKDAGISVASLKRARASLNVKSRKESTGEWVVSLPPRLTALKSEGVQASGDAGHDKTLSALHNVSEPKGLTTNALNLFPEPRGKRVNQADPESDSDQPEESKGFKNPLRDQLSALHNDPLQPTGTDGIWREVL